MKIWTINKSINQLAKYSDEELATMDLRTNIEKEILLEPLERVISPTTMFLEIPVSFEAKIRPCRGLTIERNLIRLNSYGTIAADFKEEVCNNLANLS